MQKRNPVGTDGFDFLEFTTPDSKSLTAQFESMGFEHVSQHQTLPVTIYQKGDIRLIINLTDNSHASQYARLHGTSVSAMGLKVRDANTALQYVRLKGATAYQPLDETPVYDMPAIYGVGNTLIYLVDAKNSGPSYAHQFSAMPRQSTESGYLSHITHHLYRGNMIKWADFYTRLFHFRESSPINTECHNVNNSSTRMISPCEKIHLPLYESYDESEFLHHFNGEGIQRLLFDPIQFEIIPDVAIK